MLACALVCRAWLPCSRSKLFHTIVIDGTQSWARFKVILSPSTPSHIAPYLKTVRKLVVFPIGENEEDVWSHEILGACLEYMTGLKRIELDSFTFTSEWRSSLQSIAPYFSLQALKIQDMYGGDLMDLHQLISTFPNLAQLVLNEVFMYSHPPNALNTLPKLPSLADLVMHDIDSTIVQWLPDSGLMSNLRRLDWRGPDVDFELWGILAEAINDSSLLSVRCDTLNAQPCT